MSVCETPTIFGQIYVLIDPTIASITGGYIRYPGKHQLEEQKELDLQKSLELYLDSKVKKAKIYEGKNPQFVWLREMSLRNIRPIIKCIEVCYSLSELNSRETYWIAFYRKRYSDLLNIADGGGDGGWGWNKGLTKETDERVAISAQHMSENHADVSGDKNPMAGENVKDHMTLEAYEEMLQNRSEAQKIAQNDPVLKEAKSIMMSGDGNPMFGIPCTYKMTEEEIQEWKDNISKAGKGKKKKPFTKEHKDNISKSRQGITPWNKGLKKETDARVAQYGKTRIENKRIDNEDQTE